jgi:ATP synthase protein I
MTDDRRGDAWAGMGTGWAITSMLISGMLAWGGIGYLADLLFGTYHVFMPIGILLGGGGGVYLVYLRYGTESRDQR